MRRILTILLILIVVAGAGWYFYAKSHQTQPGVPSITDFSAFFPVGSPTIPGQSSNTTGVGEASNTSAISSPFTQVTPHPVAGYSIFTQQVPTTIPPDPSNPKSKAITQTIAQSALRYVSRGNGYIYEVTNGNLPLQISNVYIPNIYESVFGDNSNTAILRFLHDDQKTIATYSVPIPPPNPDGTRTQKEGVYFPDGITALAVSPSGSQVAYITDDTTGATLQLSSTIDTKRLTILHTPFEEWILSWPNPKTLYLQTKASAQVPGFLYKVDTTEKKLRRVLGNINGLTASVSPSGTYILYSQSTTNGFVTKLLNTKTNTTTALSLDILPEKCAWLKNEELICAGGTSVPNGSYPDTWYQGIVTFSDKLYHIYTSNNLYDVLYDGSKKSFDMTNLSVDEQNRLIYFIDKPSGLLWQMKY